MSHIILFEEEDTGATIGIRGFRSSDGARKWITDQGLESIGTVRGLVPIFSKPDIAAKLRAKERDAQ